MLCSKSESNLMAAGLHQGYPLTPILFTTFMEKLSKPSQAVEAFHFGGLGITSLLFCRWCGSFGFIKQWSPARTGVIRRWLWWEWELVPPGLRLRFISDRRVEGEDGQTVVASEVDLHSYSQLQPLALYRNQKKTPKEISDTSSILRAF